MHHVPKDVGWIEVICGSMFSGKTEELIRRVRRAEYARQKVQLFKPLLDVRSGTSRIASHDQRAIPCMPLAAIGDIHGHLMRDTAVVGIDEAQFFSDDLVPVCEDLARRGLRVIVAALDQDFRGEPFGPIPRLLCVAEYVTKNLAICVRCGNPANRSQRLRGGGDTIQVGAGDAYEPRCRACFRPEVVNQEELDMGRPS
jgi:thymidine kinase